MASPYRIQAPRSGYESTIPFVVPNRKTIRTLGKLALEFEARIDVGLKKFVLGFAEALRAALKREGVEIYGYRYTDNLKVALVHGVEGVQAAAAVYHEEISRVLDKADGEPIRDQDLGLVYVVVRDKRKAPRWAPVLRRWSPWPPYMLPGRVDGDGLLVIFRRATRSEVSRRDEVIRASRREIDAQLHATGFGGPGVGAGGMGTAAKEDLAFEVLRAEFGLGPISKPHWRKALKSMRSTVWELGRAFEELVVHGVDRFPEVQFDELRDPDADRSFSKKIGRAASLRL